MNKLIDTEGALATELSERRATLADNIAALTTAAGGMFNALQMGQVYVSARLRDSEDGDLPSMIAEAVEEGLAKLPAEFSSLTVDPDLGRNKALVAFVRSQFFVAMIAQAETYLRDVLRLVLCAYPQKLTARKGSKPVGATFDDILSANGLVDLVDSAVDKELASLFYAKPDEHRRALEEYLSMDHERIDWLWPTYVEMRARRDLGLHNGWRKNRLYTKKVAAVDGVNWQSDFLAVDKEYYTESLVICAKLVESIGAHCNTKFGANRTGGG